ncbi:MAG: phytanoyl-CoA dioxygenase family protein [Ignavibacteriaceae bacterium]
MNDILNTFHLDEGNIKLYYEDGYLQIPDLINKSFIEELRNEVLHIMDTIGLVNSKLRQTTQYLKGSMLDSLVNSYKLKELAGKLMNGESSLYMPFTAVKSENGGGKFHFHQDNQYTEFDKPGTNFWFALNKMTLNNGCLQIDPKSHLNGTLESEPSGDGDQHKKVKLEPENFKALLMNPGDCVAFSRLTIHGSGPNNSNEPRIAYAIQFHRDDAKAKWGGNDWVLLKKNPRWSIAPVNKIVPPEEVSLDGH